MTANVLRRYLRFRVQGHAATASYRMACALESAERRGWTFAWRYDDDADLSWCECHGNPKVRHDHEVEGCVLNDADGNRLASLWGITDADDAHRAEVEGELAWEALACEARDDDASDAAREY